MWPGLQCNALFNVLHLQYTSTSDSGSPCMWLSSHRHTPVISIVFKTCECCIDFFQLAVIKELLDSKTKFHLRREENFTPKEVDWLNWEEMDKQKSVYKNSCTPISLNVNAKSQDLKLVNTKNDCAMLVFEYARSTIWKRECLKCRWVENTTVPQPSPRRLGSIFVFLASSQPLSGCLKREKQSCPWSLKHVVKSP